jgi:hypothetical protein
MAFNVLVVDDSAVMRAKVVRTPRVSRVSLGEIANVICGNVLLALAGAEAMFSLGVPRGMPAGRAPEPAACHSWEVRVGLDDGRADVRLRVSEPAPSGEGCAA